MPNENPLPDELRGLIEKRSAKDRRKKSPGPLSDDEDGQAAAAARRPPRDRRQQKNFRDLLDEDDE
ncbi:MAG TPA: hypothetical protein PLY87_21810 [Planctomycetaceae bacterium]|nr:hypothetical protein [Planctomycetaceae bacterium]HQZ67748.1 hypothetical protein [Planctomycetaceae bacterium]HRA87013.1 hypothetical protein [Planctomycetaceae bacterium]